MSVDYKLSRLQLWPLMHLKKGGKLHCQWKKKKRDTLNPPQDVFPAQLLASLAQFDPSGFGAASQRKFHHILFWMYFWSTVCSLRLPGALDVLVFQLWAIHQKNLNLDVLCITVLWCLSRCVSPRSAVLTINVQECWKSFPLPSMSLYDVVFWIICVSLTFLVCEGLKKQL